MRTVEFLNFLDETNRLRVSFDVEQGMVEAFVVQYEARLDGRWVPVVRYDTAHGFAHLDVLKPDGTTEKHQLAEKDYNEALLTATEDLKAHWRVYRRRYAGWSGNS